MEKYGVNSLSVKEFNRSLVLKLICTHKDVSRIWLSKETGLTRMTLSNIIGGLIESGFVTNVHDLTAGNVAGRRPVKVDLAQNSPVVAGIFVGRNELSGILMDLKANMLHRVCFRMDRQDNAASLTDKMTAAIDELVRFSARPILGIGVSSIGPVDIKEGIILNPTNFYGITNITAKKTIEEKTGLPVFLRNDMSAAALAEKYYGCGINVPDFVYIGITHGLGSGIVSGGELFRSKSGFSGEFGHMSIDHNGARCGCGNRGCIELYASAPNIIETVNRNCGSALVSMEEVNSLCERDGSAAQVMFGILGKLSVALTGIVNLFDPSLVIVGGYGSLLGMQFIQYIEDQVNESILARANKTVSIKRSEFGQEGHIIGAAAIVADLVFTDRLKVLNA